MILLIVTAQEKPFRLLIQRYRTEETGPKERLALHTLFVFLVPLAKRIARDVGGNLSILV